MTKENTSKYLNVQQAFLLMIFLWFMSSCGLTMVSRTPLVDWQKTYLSRPAMVLYAEKAFKEDGSPLTQFETLKSDELITLNDGFLLIQHFSCRLYEYAGDTTLVASVAVAHSPNEKPVMPLELKFIFNKIPYKNNPVATTRENRRFPDYFFLYPFNSTFEVNKNELICLWWGRNYHDVSPEVNISIRDLNDKKLTSFRTDEPRIEVPVPKNTSENLLVIELGNEEEYAPEIGVMITENEPKLSPCNASTSIEYLQIATTLEHHRHFREAYEFFERAASASPRPIYEQLKLNALQRLF